MEKNYDPYKPERSAKVQEPETPGWKARQKMRRDLVQDFHRLVKTCASLVEARKDARAWKRLDDVQNLTEAIYHIKLAITYLRQIARSAFDKSLEELEGYK